MLAEHATPTKLNTIEKSVCLFLVTCCKLQQPINRNGILSGHRIQIMLLVCRPGYCVVLTQWLYVCIISLKNASAVTRLLLWILRNIDSNAKVLNKLHYFVYATCCNNGSFGAHTYAFFGNNLRSWNNYAGKHRSFAGNVHASGSEMQRHFRNKRSMQL